MAALGLGEEVGRLQERVMVELGLKVQAGVHWAKKKDSPRQGHRVSKCSDPWKSRGRSEWAAGVVGASGGRG